MATKTETISLKVSPEEKELIQQQARLADMTVSKYLYRKLFAEIVQAKLQKDF